MKLLFEEFFEGIFKVGRGQPTLSILIKVLFIIICVSILSLLFYSLISKRYWILYILLGGFIIAEISHLIRKSREKMVVKRRRVKEKISGQKNLLENKKSENKNLLESSKSKNNELLGKSSKNKGLLKK